MNPGGAQNTNESGVLVVGIKGRDKNREIGQKSVRKMTETTGPLLNSTESNHYPLWRKWNQKGSMLRHNRHSRG